MLLLTSSSPVRLGTLPSLAEHYLPAVVHAMEQDGIPVDLTVLHTSEELTDMLHSRELDAILVDRFKDDKPDFWNRELWTEPYYVIMPIDHPLAGEQSICLESLAEQPLIMYPPACSIRKKMTSLFAEMKAVPHIKTEVPFGAFIPGYTAAGAGIGILPQMVAAQLSHARLTAVPLHHPLAEREISIAAIGSAAGEQLLPYLRPLPLTRDDPDATRAPAGQ
ncbi:LysR family transcriptional regulator substrate-binding protein [Paenibacillus hexagrammi]|uniref:LysR family transcriptional regulator substrate-binding protein n=1 Tax=Paenibacillus hexagrammi TaxID=2908839 RepID=A0ABY3SC04_9BACL|nr:LysR family transcriptional regulator substrate-binding protein [Paenibacillus sp. YPD9-1]UJF31307.1 LysR family transcriptional regulator substrate-binding protein [Paenibacillus sp. YPD9-1]